MSNNDDSKQGSAGDAASPLGTVYGVPLSMYQGNRRRLAEKLRGVELGRTEKQHVIVVQGAEEAFRHDSDHEPLFRQESNFYYLFGVNFPGAYGTIDVETGYSILFVPRLSAEYEIWCGKNPTLREMVDKYGVDECHFADEIATVLKERKAGVLHVLNGQNTDSKLWAKPAWFPGMGCAKPSPTYDVQYDDDNSNDTSEEAKNNVGDFVVDRRHLHAAIYETRLIKSAEELDLMQFVNDLSSEAHKEVMRQIRPGMSEYQLESIFKHYCLMKGGSRYSAYQCICGSGENSSVLHYGHAGAPNDRVIGDSDMMLLDMGSEYFGYASDITCSYPSNGKFTKEQAIVYEAVWAAQQAVYKALKPGVEWVEMHKVAERAILEHLVAANLVVANGKSIAELRDLGLGAVFMPHGLGHLMGLDTHDVGGYPAGAKRVDEPGLRNLRMNRTVQPGMVLTVEPGCYFIDALLEKALSNDTQKDHLNAVELKKYRSFGGVRLEDDVYITDTGFVNMTKVPRGVKEVEAFMAEENAFVRNSNNSNNEKSS
eukprot:TRINITY_DN30321_c0_g1_i1.p1 TRINITY_DN30321_c0_g1~~TRINITY_DN30321_c0_g1_i1.p1  ORF type:complete len:540 (+),score=309.19 TRINITY_DN30321_c0_g1_i1:18-1637(+)